MGNCSSCLGFGRKRTLSDDSDASHLLGGEYQPQYGAANTSGPHGPQVDPEEIRRQRDALERLCVQTSGRLIDVTQPEAVEEAATSRSSDYSRLFASRFRPSSRASGPARSLPEAASHKVPADGGDGQSDGPAANRPSSDKYVADIRFLSRIIRWSTGNVDVRPGVNQIDWERVNGVKEAGPLVLNWDKFLDFDTPPAPRPIRAY